MSPIISRRIYESLLISAVGLLLHINSWTLLQLPLPWRQYLENSLKMEEEHCIFTMLPNSASGLFLVSLLGYLSMFRPHYPWTLARWKRLSLLIAEMVIIVYCGEVILLKMWQPIFRVISMTFHQFADHLESQNNSVEVKWFCFMIRYKAINFLRFILAAIMFIYTLNVSDWLHIFCRCLRRVFDHYSYYECVEFRCFKYQRPAREVIERQMLRSPMYYRMQLADNLENAHNTHTKIK